ncbi:hypothetical protein EDB83DRAFT_877169 [Lactarius deliciosus]|nr:hypothetical protein EDB83DRAFT_877169 [Lactarius deliciosus]
MMKTTCRHHRLRRGSGRSPPLPHLVGSLVQTADKRAQGHLADGRRRVIPPVGCSIDSAASAPWTLQIPNSRCGEGNQSRSGKSSLIKAVFQVDATAEPKDTRGKTDINVEFQPEDNRYLIVHECSVSESQPGDSQNLQTIRDFISYRTDASRSPLERICVPASDAITGRFGEGVEDILNIRTVPVILVLTKFDMTTPVGAYLIKTYGICQ